MNRLRDQSGDDPIAREGIALLRRTPATTTQPEVQRRVWATLQARPRRRGLIGLPRWRTLAVAAMLVCMAGTAGAMISQRWILPALARRSHPAPATPAPVRRVPASGSRALAAPAPAADQTDAAGTLALAPVEAPLSAEAAAPAVPARRGPATTTPYHRPPGPGVARAARPLASGLPRVAGPMAAAERTEVLDAMIALRRDHDPVRASRLLDGYLARHQHGTLREEALVLAIEAAAARDEAGLAQGLARAYLLSYPKGRFVEFARGHLAQPSLR
jgi:hypothetical protein